jgi:hypothetical protein
MTILISGPGVGLPPPQNLYPAYLSAAPYEASTNYIALSGGDVQTIPAGRWWVDLGAYSVLQYLDPVTGVWRSFSSARSQPLQVVSDGFTRRVANLTGCPIGAIVNNGGSAFAASTATITANVGGSLWTAIVGGSLSVSTISVAGSGYSVAPLVYIPAPPNPGVQAVAYATLTGTSVTGVTLSNVGAGYLSAPTAVILPNPVDPNAGSVTTASVTLILNAAESGAITGALCTYNGAPLATISALTLTAAGGSGTGATINPVVLQTVTSASVVAGGGGWGVVAVPAKVTTAGGQPTITSAIGNPSIELTGFKPRDANIAVTTSSAGAISAPVVIDGGLFANTPTPVIIPGGTVPTTLASVALTMGSLVDTVTLQPL